MCDVGYFCANFSLPIGLSVLELSPMYATDRKTDVRRQTKVSLNASALWGWRHNNGGTSANANRAWRDPRTLRPKCTALNTYVL